MGRVGDSGRVGGGGGHRARCGDRGTGVVQGAHRFRRGIASTVGDLTEPAVNGGCVDEQHAAIGIRYHENVWNQE